jgi:alcohol dehydrogenase class IV
MMKAANLSGKAIDLTLTTACHAISYPFTSYFGIPHGHAVALTLGSMLVYNSKVSAKDCLDKRGPDYVQKSTQEITALLGCKSAEEAKRKIEQLMERIGMKTRLSELGLKSTDIGTIVKNGFNPERVKNNPRLLTEQNLRKILENIF